LEDWDGTLYRNYLIYYKLEDVEWYD
jgi:hypothetical protein